MHIDFLGGEREGGKEGAGTGKGKERSAEEVEAGGPGGWR